MYHFRNSQMHEVPSIGWLNKSLISSVDGKIIKWPRSEMKYWHVNSFESETRAFFPSYFFFSSSLILYFSSILWFMELKSSSTKCRITSIEPSILHKKCICFAMEKLFYRMFNVHIENREPWFKWRLNQFCWNKEKNSKNIKFRSKNNVRVSGQKKQKIEKELGTNINKMKSRKK